MSATTASPSNRGRSIASRKYTRRCCTCCGTWFTSPWERTMSSDNGNAVPFADCPLPLNETTEILLGHGSGGKLTSRLIENTILPAFRNPILETLDDQAIVSINGSRVAFTTDSYVVTPIFFPGGDIGDLAVNGTVNDLAVGGA